MSLATRLRAATDLTEVLAWLAGYWASAMEDLKSEMKKGQTVYVTSVSSPPPFAQGFPDSPYLSLHRLQFGHNDQAGIVSHQSDSVHPLTRAFCPSLQKIAPASSMAANLTWMANEIKELGGHPVLITSLTRRNFVNGTDTIKDALADWAEGTSSRHGPQPFSLLPTDDVSCVSTATIGVAHNVSAPLLDLHAASIAYVERIGPNATYLLNRLPNDFTHLNLSGQLLFG